MHKEINSVLIIKPGAIGDLLQLTPAIKAVKNRFRNARISLIVGSSTTAELFRYNPAVHETIVFDGKGGHKDFRSLFSLRRSLRGKKFDLVINYQRSNLKTWLLASASFPCRVLVYNKSKDPKIHAVMDYLKTIAPLVTSTPASDLELFISEDDARFADNLFTAEGLQEKPVIALNPGATQPVNRWGTDKFADLADALVERLSAKIVIIGGKEDVVLADEIASKMNSKPMLLAGKTSLLQLGAVLKRCDVVVSGDTGPLHLATAVGTKVAALFGAADPARTGPVGKGHRVVQARNVPCVPCRSRKCSNRDHLECMKKISAEEVFNAVSDMIKHSTAM